MFPFKKTFIAAALVAAAFFSPAIQTQAQDTEPPLECTTNILNYLQCNDLVDSLNVDEIIFDRGNCKPINVPVAIKEKDHVNQLGHFKFGEAFLAVPEDPCNLIEIRFRTDHGDWTWRVQ